ncbi:MAG: hypothetical protein QM586_04600 [Xenophilus sp.]
MLGVHMMGDCAPPPLGESCWAYKEAALRNFLLIGIAIHVPVTWNFSSDAARAEQRQTGYSVLATAQAKRYPIA